VTGFCEHGGETLVSKKGKEVIDQLRDCQLLETCFDRLHV
jgi:hypothetical protein